MSTWCAKAGDGTVEMLWNVPYAFTAEGLSATGVVDGHEVRCLSREMQEQAHTGYELPAHHVQDIRLLYRAHLTARLRRSRCRRSSGNFPNTAQSTEWSHARMHP